MRTEALQVPYWYPLLHLHCGVWFYGWLVGWLRWGFLLCFALLCLIFGVGGCGFVCGFFCISNSLNKSLCALFSIT